MGIPGLFAWVRKNSPHVIRAVRHNNIRQELDHNIDNLCLDMNGIFHEACQKVYKYGSYASKNNSDETELLPPKKMQKKVFYEIGNIVNNLVYRVSPSKRVLIMVDGPAGNAKQSQQRQRRYRSALDTEKKFDSNCISPGTEWMDHLSKYMDQFIRREITFNRIWKNLEVIFSNEKVVGEGEHKAVKFIRKHGSPTESYMIYGLDADLIMLALSTQNILARNSYSISPPKFYILRDDQYTHQLLIIDISMFREFLIGEITWGMDCSRNSLINDYIFLCFLLGNDFLPHSPTVDLIEGGLELLFESYSGACEKHNRHLIEDGKFIPEVLKDILHNISIYENMILEDTIRKGDKFADPLLQKHISSDENGNKSLNFEMYRKEYYKSKFPSQTPQKVCHEYFHGMEWVYKYYTSGIPSWTWSYPFNYSPFAREMVESLDTYQTTPFEFGKPMELYKQLLSILPPQSKHLLPQKFHSLIETFPSSVIVDLAGKKFDWQGVVIIKSIPNFENEYKEILNSMTHDEKKRNFLGKQYKYTNNPNLKYPYKNYYGEFESSANVEIFE